MFYRNCREERAAAHPDPKPEIVYRIGLTGLQEKSTGLLEQKAEHQFIMRSSKSRSRSKSNRNRSVGNVVNRVFDSSGPEGKVRGTPQQIIDKYNQMARDSLLGNDRVATENFQQHAEHYVRMLGQAQREADARREQQEAQNRERQREREEARAAEQQSHGSRDGFSTPVDADPAKT